MGRALISGIVVGGIYGLIALGIVLVYRGSRVLNLAAIETGTLGVFVAWALIERAGMPWMVGALAGIAAAALVSFAFERLVVARMVDASRLTVAVATIGLGALLIAFEIKVWTASPRFLSHPIKGLGPEILGVNVSPTQILSLIIVAALGFGLAWFLRRTDFGLGVLAAAQDPVATQMVGVRLWKVSAFTWTLAGALSAIAMLLVEPSIGGFAAGTLNGLFVPSLAAALVGGLTNPSGAFVGGIAMGLIDQVVRLWFIDITWLPGAGTMAIFAAMLLVLMLRPQGLMGKARA
ncbi:MAG TPA: branched-chain amino acid ABC transporter permease [Actinomycetota bacterium]